LKGRGRIVLSPLLDAFPFFGGIRLTFLDSPALSFDLDGLADVGDWPGLRKKIRKTLNDEIEKAAVYPNCVSVSAAGDPQSARCSLPSGLLALKVMKAEGLPRKGGLRSLVGQDKPDCYAVVNLGAEKRKTSVVKDDCNPEFPDNGW